MKNQLNDQANSSLSMIDLSITNNLPIVLPFTKSSYQRSPCFRLSLPASLQASDLPVVHSVSLQPSNHQNLLPSLPINHHQDSSSISSVELLSTSSVRFNHSPIKHSIVSWNEPNDDDDEDDRTLISTIKISNKDLKNLKHLEKRPSSILVSPTSCPDLPSLESKNRTDCSRPISPILRKSSNKNAYSPSSNRSVRFSDPEPFATGVEIDQESRNWWQDKSNNDSRHPTIIAAGDDAGDRNRNHFLNIHGTSFDSILMRDTSYDSLDPFPSPSPSNRFLSTGSNYQSPGVVSLPDWVIKEYLSRSPSTSFQQPPGRVTSNTSNKRDSLTRSNTPIDSLPHHSSQFQSRPMSHLHHRPQWSMSSTSQLAHLDQLKLDYRRKSIPQPSKSNSMEASLVTSKKQSKNNPSSSSSYPSSSSFSSMRPCNLNYAIKRINQARFGLSKPTISPSSSSISSPNPSLLPPSPFTQMSPRDIEAPTQVPRSSTSSLPGRTRPRPGKVFYALLDESEVIKFNQNSNNYRYHHHRPSSAIISTNIIHPAPIPTGTPITTKATTTTNANATATPIATSRFINKESSTSRPPTKLGQFLFLFKNKKLKGSK